MYGFPYKESALVKSGRYNYFCLVCGSYANHTPVPGSAGWRGRGGGFLLPTRGTAPGIHQALNSCTFIETSCVTLSFSIHVLSISPTGSKLALKWPGGLRSFTKHFLNEGYCEWKPWEHKLVGGGIKIQIKVKQNAEGEEKQLRAKLVKFCVYVHLPIVYTTLSRKYLRELKCPRDKAHVWMEEKAWVEDPQTRIFCLLLGL